MTKRHKFRKHKQMARPTNKKFLLTITLSAILIVGLQGPARSSNILYCPQKIQCSQCFNDKGAYFFLYSCCNNSLKDCSIPNTMTGGGNPFKSYTSYTECEKYRESFGCAENCKVNLSTHDMHLTCPSHANGRLKHKSF